MNKLMRITWIAAIAILALVAAACGNSNSEDAGSPDVPTTETTIAATETTVPVTETTVEIMIVAVAR